LIIATAGHIDHGKTALVQALTGVNSDRLPEEQRRGMSIDLGFAYTEFSGVRIGIVDVPGHEKFVRNMLAGVTAVDCALLVVAADDGPMPQTREHLDILSLLDVDRAVVALTKIDRVDAQRIDEVTADIIEMLSTTRLAGASVHPVCAPRDEGLDALTEALLAGHNPELPTDNTHNFRLAVDRSFTVTGAGLVVTGHIFSGTVNVDDHLIVSPDGTEVRVRGLHANDNHAQTAHAGQRCALNLTGQQARREGVARGRWLVAEPGFAPTNRFDARVRVLASHSGGLKHWTPVHLHLGTQDITARVATLEGEVIEPGEEALVRISTDRPIAAWTGDRFILRDQSARNTLAGGTVLDALPPQRGRSHQWRIGYLNAVNPAAPAAALASQTRARATGVGIDDFSRGWNLTDERLEMLLNETNLTIIGTGDDRMAVDEDHWASLRDRCLGALGKWHEAHPERAGMERERLRAAIEQRVSPALLDAAVASLRTDGALRVRGHLIGLPDHRARLGHGDQTLWERVLPYLEHETDKPPTMPDLAKMLELDSADLRQMAERATGAGLLAHVSGNRFFTLGRLRQLAIVAEQLAHNTEDGAFSAAAFRDASGIGRNVTIELLEYFDRVGLTRRLGNVRKLRRSASAVAEEQWGT
jgi:selenocysteine-specific elongation factor